MRIEDIYLEPSNPLVRDYLQFFHKTSKYYSYDPGDEASFSLRAARLKKKDPMVPKERLAEVIRRFHGEELRSPEAEENLRRLERADSLVVIGGQQAGLFTGPLYTLYKAITLIQLANREEKRLQRPVIPVFWIAGEDHDLEEVNHIHLPRKTKSVKLSLSLDLKKRVAAGEVAPGSDKLERWLDRLASMLPDTSRKRDLVEEMRALSQEPGSLSRHFARLMHRLFGCYGLLMIDASYSPLRHLEIPFFEWLIREARTINEQVWAAARRMEEEGYVPQVDMEETKAHFFLREDGERTALYTEGEGFRDREGNRRWSKEELLKRLRSCPADFSNNVITRPLMQEFLFPTLATVLGHGEIAYWGLLKEAFEYAGMEMPPLFPRTGVTLIGQREEKLLRRYRLTLDDVLHRLEAKKNAWLACQYQVNAGELFGQVRRRLEEIYRPLLGEIGGLRPDLTRLGEANWDKVLQEIGWLEKETVKAMEEREEADLRRFAELAAALFPGGSLQERIYNVLPYWNAYGEEWIQRLTETPLLSKETHRVVYL
ncbi:bacillithiol biosynthesis cysteine-adding enzyme BshC [Salinithrix halophila]|uniref:Putative cysteine ligase BshC n=1 Tax=Salinithrix halophila TaxID=1485204 RepID=A0ABV8JCC4_9BACL